MIGQTLAHYRVTAALGAGGAGEVYRANDEKLGRDVAFEMVSKAFEKTPTGLKFCRIQGVCCRSTEIEYCASLGASQ